MKNKQPKLLLVISSDLFVRNYIRTGVVDELSKMWNLSIIATHNSKLKGDLEKSPSFAGYFETSERIEKEHFRYFTLLIFRFRNRSKTFPFRLKRDIGWHLKEEPFRWFKNLRLLLRFKKGRSARYCIWFGNRLFFNIWKSKIESALPVNEQLASYIERLDPTIIIFPSSAYDPVGNDVARIAKQRKLKSLFLVDNWDNLSSKSVFWAKPDYLGVWSEQHREHAVRIHDFQKSRVHSIGTPRFDSYFSARGRTVASPFEFPYVVFSGCCLPFDETNALKALDVEIRNHPEVYGNLKIVYRPHPWRQKRNEAPFVESEFTHTIIDPQMRDRFLARKKDLSLDVSFQPEVDYYPMILDNAEFVCGPLTTFLIESLIFYKNFMALCYDDGKHLTSPHNAYKYYEIYKGIEKHEGIHMVHEERNLVEKFRSVYACCSAKNKRSFDDWDRSLNYFLRVDGTRYFERLHLLISLVNDDDKVD